MSEEKKVRDFQRELELLQARVRATANSRPQEMVAVKSRMGGYEMQLRDIPQGQEFVLVRLS